jgi:predicted nuclease of predicted toxin-antitoxin system
MSLGFYMDVHVPLAITRGLRRRGVDVLTAQEDQTARLSDPELLRRARELGRFLFSQDEDLIAEAVRCQREGAPFATVVFSRQLDLSIGRCVGALETLAKAAGPDDVQGQIIFL